MNRENKHLIERLKSKYADDAEALELIERTEKDIDYFERKEADADYTGQISEQHLLELEAFLHGWY